jgi:hypothetical protein
MDRLATTGTRNTGSVSKHTAYYNSYFIDGLKLGISLGLRNSLISIVVIDLGLIAWELLK